MKHMQHDKVHKTFAGVPGVCLPVGEQSAERTSHVARSHPRQSYRSAGPPLFGPVEIGSAVDQDNFIALFLLNEHTANV